MLLPHNPQVSYIHQLCSTKSNVCCWLKGERNGVVSTQMLHITPLSLLLTLANTQFCLEFSLLLPYYMKACKYKYDFILAGYIHAFCAGQLSLAADYRNTIPSRYHNVVNSCSKSGQGPYTWNRSHVGVEPCGYIFVSSG